MVTRIEALAAYNAQHGTTYATVAALAADLAAAALREAWMAKKRNEAHAAAEIEVIS
jgi:hypothetical protein